MVLVVGNVELVILSVEEGVPFGDTGDIRYKGKGTCKQEFSLIDAPPKKEKQFHKRFALIKNKKSSPQLAIILLKGPSLFGVGIEKPRWWAPFREQVRSMGQSSWLTTVR
ncbi:hypothetical protein V1478_014695 [Vespula squamosa]|uniref:Uncharacterized protein n=1 Tax=Vespula squamosa TaxID=30214 RepID=A0ABD2A3Q0_VESSQ